MLGPGDRSSDPQGLDSQFHIDAAWVCQTAYNPSVREVETAPLQSKATSQNSDTERWRTADGDTDIYLRPITWICTPHIPHTAIYTWICTHTCTPHTWLHAHICIYSYTPHCYIHMDIHAHMYTTHTITCAYMHIHIHATWLHIHEYACTQVCHMHDYMHRYAYTHTCHMATYT